MNWRNYVAGVKMQNLDELWAVHIETCSQCRRGKLCTYGEILSKDKTKIIMERENVSLPIDMRMKKRIRDDDYHTLR